jgi:DNA polymerase III subunit gamma/tau
MSDNYIVSARKYRPQTFDTVVGQEHITTTLKNAIRNKHLAHAYLFCGPRGVGKTSCARILAKTINCEHPTPDMEACGVCPTCQSFNTNNSFNVFELDAASNNSVDDIRELVSQVRFAPQQGRYKIYIIDEVHMLSASAFNAFLKTLEEPPPYAIFILATTEKHKIIPTILSRCQIFDFKRITTKDIVLHLQSIAAKESMFAQEAALHVIAQKSEGCMRDALSMLDRIASFTNGMLNYENTMAHLNMLDANFYFMLTDMMLGQDIGGSLLLLDETLEKGFEGDVILNGLAEHLRNLLLCKDARMTKLLDVPTEHKPMYNEKANQTPPNFILSGLNVINDAELEYKNATNKRLHVELCLIRLCYLLQATKPQINTAGDNAEIKKKPDSDLISYQTNTETVSIAPINQNNAAQAVPIPTLVQTPLPQSSYPEIPQNITTTSPSSITPRTPITGGAAKRVSKNFLNMLDAEVKEAKASTEPKKELTPQIVVEVFDKYKQKLQAENKSAFHAQFSTMKAEMQTVDEIRIIAPNDFTEEYAKKERNVLIDFFSEHTGVLVRITTEVRIDESQNNSPVEKVLSRNEMYDAMAAQNPELARLKDALNLQIDY